MRCKPNDLAVVVHSGGDGIPGRINKMLLGRIVRVLYLRRPSNGLACTADLVWHFERPVKLVVDGEKYTVDGIADECLLPINNPGEDAQDETLLWAGLPNREEVEQ